MRRENRARARCPEAATNLHTSLRCRLRAAARPRDLLQVAQPRAVVHLAARRRASDSRAAAHREAVDPWAAALGSSERPAKTVPSSRHAVAAAAGILLPAVVARSARVHDVARCGAVAAAPRMQIPNPEPMRSRVRAGRQNAWAVAPAHLPHHVRSVRRSPPCRRWEVFARQLWQPQAGPQDSQPPGLPGLPFCRYVMKRLQFG